MSTCKRCGKCCIQATFGILRTDKGDLEGEKRVNDMITWINYHGCDVAHKKDAQQNKKYYLTIPILCVHLDFRNEGYSCKIYDKRPDLCRRYEYTNKNM